MPVIVPIVLYNGKNKWTAARNFKEILKRLKLIGRIPGKKGSKEQIQVFNRWMINVFKNRFDERCNPNEYITEIYFPVKKRQ